MKVKALIEELLKFRQEAIVTMCDRYDEGTFRLESLEPQKVQIIFDEEIIKEPVHLEETKTLFDNQGTDNGQDNGI